MKKVLKVPVAIGSLAECFRIYQAVWETTGTGLEQEPAWK